MRAALLGLSLVLLAGCGGGGLAPLPTEAVTAGFPPHGIADTIRIHAVDRLPLRTAELIAPDGAATPGAVEVDPSPGFTTTQRLGNDPYSGDVFGVGNIAAAAPAAVPSGDAPQTETRLLMMVSDAAIPLPDAVAYRKNWALYRVRLVFGTPPAALETKTIAAPKPPAG